MRNVSHLGRLLEGFYGQGIGLDDTAGAALWAADVKLARSGLLQFLAIDSFSAELD